MYNYESSDDESGSAQFNNRKSKSLGAPSKASLGSDTCAFETMTDSAANEIMVKIAASIKGKDTLQSSSGASKLPL